MRTDTARSARPGAPTPTYSRPGTSHSIFEKKSSPWVTPRGGNRLVFRPKIAWICSRARRTIAVEHTTLGGLGVPTPALGGEVPIETGLSQR